MPADSSLEDHNLPGALADQLCDALILAFPTPEKLRNFARYKVEPRVAARIRQRNHPAQGPLVETTTLWPAASVNGDVKDAALALISACESHGCVDELVRALLAEHPLKADHPPFPELRAFYSIREDDDASAPPVPVTDTAERGGDMERGLRQAFVMTLPIPVLTALLLVARQVRGAGATPREWAWFAAYCLPLPVAMIALRSQRHRLRALPSSRRVVYAKIAAFVGTLTPVLAIVARLFWTGQKTLTDAFSAFIWFHLVVTLAIVAFIASVYGWRSKVTSEP